MAALKTFAAVLLGLCLSLPAPTPAFAAPAAYVLVKGASSNTDMTVFADMASRRRDGAIGQFDLIAVPANVDGPDAWIMGMRMTVDCEARTARLISTETRLENRTNIPNDALRPEPRVLEDTPEDQQLYAVACQGAVFPGPTFPDKDSAVANLRRIPPQG